MNFKPQLKQFTQLYLSNQNILSFTILWPNIQSVNFERLVKHDAPQLD